MSIITKIYQRIKPYLPAWFVNFHIKIRTRRSRFRTWYPQWKAYRQLERQYKGSKRPLNVVFLVIYSSVWKSDSLYQLMLKDKRFNPVILICPIVDYGKEHMVENLQRTKAYFERKQYNYICAYDEHTGNYLEIDTLNPDILFYSFQWSDHVDPRYNVFTLRDYLKCIVNYSYKNNPFEWSIASVEQGLMWLYFSECEDNRKLALSFNPIEFRNIRVVGYPLYDEMQTTKATGKDWKINKPSHKRIIWAPHHSIDGADKVIKLSTFLLYADFMLDMVDKYQHQVEFVFKPHPQLKHNLYNHPAWGKERTDDYYAKWANGVNTTITEGDYVDLFLSSDAMIHDCHSFTVEYLYTKKPVLFLANYDRESQCNEVGKKALRCHYQAISKDKIESFITDVVLNGNDTLKEKRQKFYDDILVPPNGKSVAENIIETICQKLKI